jgi:hypothetical protein
MILHDWQADYGHYRTLGREQWAWEFLRRNPDYQADYQRFIAIWRALEADYGAPPARDFLRWKADPRAYGPLPGESDGALDGATGELCTGDDERVFIECWLGAKWGFHKFPPDPRLDTPGREALSFRPPPPAPPREAQDPYRLDFAFDLSLPLAPQLDSARLRLASRVAELRRAGLAAPRAVANECAHWQTLLRVLDADAAGVPTAQRIAAGLIEDEGHGARLRAQALAMTRAGYRDILRLAD